MTRNQYIQLIKRQLEEGDEAEAAHRAAWVGMRALGREVWAWTQLRNPDLDRLVGALAAYRVIYN